MSGCVIRIVAVWTDVFFSSSIFDMYEFNKRQYPLRSSAKRVLQTLDKELSVS